MCQRLQLRAPPRQEHLAQLVLPGPACDLVREFLPRERPTLERGRDGLEDRLVVLLGDAVPAQPRAAR